MQKHRIDARSSWGRCHILQRASYCADLLWLFTRFLLRMDTHRKLKCTWVCRWFTLICFMRSLEKVLVWLGVTALWNLAKAERKYLSNVEKCRRTTSNKYFSLFHSLRQITSLLIWRISPFHLFLLTLSQLSGLLAKIYFNYGSVTELSGSCTFYRGFRGLPLF